jgi:hypothetical protein
VRRYMEMHIEILRLAESKAMLDSSVFILDQFDS